MVNKFALVLIFAVFFLLDGLFLPGIFGFKEGVLVLAFLLAMILNWGATASILWLGSGVSLFLEFFWKLQPGSLMLLFLTAALAHFFILSLFSIKRYVGAVILSFALPSVVFGVGWGAFVGSVTAFVGFLLAFILFDTICSEKKNIKFH